MLKRKSSPKACFLCLKAQEICDESHPCGRCVSKGVAQMCFNSDFSNKKVPARISKPELLKGSYPFPHEGQRQSESASDDKPEAANVDNESIGALLAELRGIREDQKKLHEEVRALKQQNERLETRLGLSSFAKQLESNTSQLNAANGRIAVSLATLAERLNSGSPRQFPRPKIDSNIVHTLTPRSTPPPGISNAEDSNGHPSHSLIVVFDLTTKPATVMSATDNFCKMMGYAMHEVTGMPWHKFIHPNYIDRTMNIFNQTHPNTTIQFSQVYKTKDGHVFNTLDTHKIFYGTDGKPISDIVSILLQKPQSVSTVPASGATPSNPQLLSITEKEGAVVDEEGPMILHLDESGLASSSGLSHPPSPTDTPQPPPLPLHSPPPQHTLSVSPQPSSMDAPPLIYSPPSPSMPLSPSLTPPYNTLNLPPNDLTDLENFICSLPSDELAYHNTPISDDFSLSLDPTLNVDTTFQPNTTNGESYGDIFEYILSP